MTLQLAAAAQSFVRLAGADGWVGMTHFRLRGHTDDQSVLAALLEHELYGSNYAGGEPGTDPARHGPYWRDRVTIDSFDRVDVSTAEAELPPIAELHRYLRTAARAYRLRELSADAVHDWGWVLYEFQEFVLIGPGELTLVVSGVD